MCYLTRMQIFVGPIFDTQSLLSMHYLLQHWEIFQCVFLTSEKICQCSKTILYYKYKQVKKYSVVGFY